MVEIFAAGVARADLLNGMVRLECVSLVPGAAGEEPKVEPSQVLWLPLDGFLRTVPVLESLIQQMVEKDIIRPNPPVVNKP